MNAFIHENGAINHDFVDKCGKLGQLLYVNRVQGQLIQVRQHRHFRWLLINHVLQSVINLNRPDHLLFPHLIRLAEIWKELPSPDSVLELGLGAGAIRSFIKKHYPSARNTSIDKNPDVIHCYKKYFGGHPTESLFCSDALKTLTESDGYDWLIVDLFSHREAPLFLYQQDFYEKLQHSVNQNGWLFINFISEHPSQLIQLKRVVQCVFNHPPELETFTGFDNHLIWVQNR